MQDLSEKKNNWGGFRVGAGRKKAEIPIKKITICLRADVFEEMEKRATQLNMTVNRYMRELIEDSVRSDNENLEEKHADALSEEKKFGAISDLFFSKAAADQDEIPYTIDKKNTD